MDSLTSCHSAHWLQITVYRKAYDIMSIVEVINGSNINMKNIVDTISIMFIGKSALIEFLCVLLLFQFELKKIFLLGFLVRYHYYWPINVHRFDEIKTFWFGNVIELFYLIFQFPALQFHKINWINVPWSTYTKYTLNGINSSKNDGMLKNQHFKKMYVHYTQCILCTLYTSESIIRVDNEIFIKYVWKVLERASDTVRIAMRDCTRINIMRSIGICVLSCVEDMKSNVKSWKLNFCWFSKPNIRRLVWKMGQIEWNVHCTLHITFDARMAETMAKVKLKMKNGRPKVFMYFVLRVENSVTKDIRECSMFCSNVRLNHTMANRKLQKQSTGHDYY